MIFSWRTTMLIPCRPYFEFGLGPGACSFSSINQNGQWMNSSFWSRRQFLILFWWERTSFHSDSGSDLFFRWQRWFGLCVAVVSIYGRAVGSLSCYLSSNVLAGNCLYCCCWLLRQRYPVQRSVCQCLAHLAMHFIAPICYSFFSSFFRWGAVQPWRRLILIQGLFS